MNKLKELFKDFRDFPALVVSVILIVATLAFFGYVFYLMDRVEPKQTGEQNVATDASGSKEKSSVIEYKADETKPEEILDGSKIKITSNKERTDFEVWNDKAKAGDIKEEMPSRVEIFKWIGNDVYLGVAKDKLKNNLFGGPQEIYKLDLENALFSKVFGEDAFVSDISPDGSKLISIERFYIENDIYNYLNVYNLATHESKSYQAPQGCKAAGNAFFSKDGKKIAYEIATGNTGKEIFQLYAIDLATGEQAQVSDKNAYGKAKVWVENN